MLVEICSCFLVGNQETNPDSLKDKNCNKALEKAKQKLVESLGEVHEMTVKQPFISVYLSSFIFPKFPRKKTFFKKLNLKCIYKLLIYHSCIFKGQG